MLCLSLLLHHAFSDQTFLLPGLHLVSKAICILAAEALSNALHFNGSGCRSQWPIRQLGLGVVLAAVHCWLPQEG